MYFGGRLDAITFSIITIRLKSNLKMGVCVCGGGGQEGSGNIAI